MASFSQRPHTTKQRSRPWRAVSIIAIIRLVVLVLISNCEREIRHRTLNFQQIQQNLFITNSTLHVMCLSNFAMFILRIKIEFGEKQLIKI